MENIILIGYGGHGKSVADCIERTGRYNIIGYTDKKICNSKYTYLGTDDVLSEYRNKGTDKLALCIGYLGKGNIREILYQKYKSEGFIFPTIIDPSANVSESAVIGEGTFIGKSAVINAEVQIGKMCIINTAAIIEHECKIDDFSHIAVNAVLCGQVNVEKAVFVGANATVIQCINIKQKQIVPAGFTIRGEKMRFSDLSGEKWNVKFILLKAG